MKTIGIAGLALLLSACTITPGQPADPTVLLFVSGRNGDRDLYRLDIDTQTSTRVVYGDTAESGPRYDRARNRLVYQRAGDDGTELWANGRRLMRDPNGEHPPDWSPDGRHIVFSARRDSRDSLYLAGVDGSSERRLTDGPFTDRYPVFSPDGRDVVFARQTDDAGWDLYRLGLASGEVERLTRDGVPVARPSFAADGRTLVFERDYDGQSEIALLDLASGELRRLTQLPGDDRWPLLLPDTPAVVFASDPDGSGEWDLWLLELATGDLSQLTDAPGYDGMPLCLPRSALP